MKKPIGSVLLFAFVFLTPLVNGCAPAPTPIPVSPTFTPSPISPTSAPAPTSTSTSTPSATPTSIPTSITVFSTDFNSGVPTEFSGITTAESVQGYAGIENGIDVFGGDFLRNSSIPPLPTTLTLTGLPIHTSIDLHFLLAIIDSWDGSGPETCCGPDKLTIKIDNQTILSDVFDNAWMNGSQSYNPPQDAVLARVVELGFRDIDSHDQDSAYDMSKDPKFSNIPHTSTTLIVEWYASGQNWQGGEDESWAIDNLIVILNTGNH